MQRGRWVALLAVVVGCSGSAAVIGDDPPDSGPSGLGPNTDGGADASKRDSGADAGREAAVSDAGKDAPRDGGADANPGADAGPKDAGIDATPDTSPHWPPPCNRCQKLPANNDVCDRCGFVCPLDDNCGNPPPAGNGPAVCSGATSPAYPGMLIWCCPSSAECTW